MNENTNDSENPVLTFEGKKYFINELSQDIKESIKGLQIAETQLKITFNKQKLLSESIKRKTKKIRLNIYLCISCRQ